MRNSLNINTAKIEALYELANLSGIPVDESCPANIVSMSVRLPSGMKIVSLSSAQSNDSTKLERFAHEMGHCMTDSFYEGYSPFEQRAKHEKSANEWAVKHLIPFDSLCNAVKNGYRESWELAEYFDVSAAFIQKAIELYASEGNTVPTKFYKEY
jgi:hypothetical protein